MSRLLLRGFGQYQFPLRFRRLFALETAIYWTIKQLLDLLPSFWSFNATGTACQHRFHGQGKLNSITQTDHQLVLDLLPVFRFGPPLFTFRFFFGGSSEVFSSFCGVFSWGWTFALGTCLRVFLRVLRDLSKTWVFGSPEYSTFSQLTKSGQNNADTCKRLYDEVFYLRQRSRNDGISECLWQHGIPQDPRRDSENLPCDKHLEVLDNRITNFDTVATFVQSWGKHNASIARSDAA